MGFATKSLLSLSIVFAGCTSGTALDDLAKDTHAMAHDIIRATQDTQAEQQQRAARMQELIKHDHTIALGNHTGLLSAWGADSNVVLVRHHSIPQRLRSCSQAVGPQLTPAKKMDYIANCIGNIREMGQFGIVRVDDDRLTQLRGRMMELKR